MKKACCMMSVALLLATSSSAIQAADMVVDSSTLLGLGRRDISGISKETFLPATQFMGIDADKLGDGNLSLHVYGWGRADLGDNSYNDKKYGGSLTYGYMQYRLSGASTNVRAGRLFVREGIANEQLDGASIRTDLPMGFGLSAFGGATVHTEKLIGENSDGKGNALYGGRANFRYKGLLDIGVSSVIESDAPALVTHTSGNYRRVGGDIWISPVTSIDIIGHSNYNLETDQFAEHTYMLNIKPLQHLVLSGEFNQHFERSYLYSSAMFSATALNPNDKSSSMGGSASYAVSKNFEIAADYKHYTREFGTADRLGADLRTNFKENSVRSGIGYHYLDAGQGFAIGSNPSASYHELRCYTMYDSKSYFAALDVLGHIFKDKIYNEKSDWETTASLGYHITPAIALSGDVSYGRNPQFTEEVRAVIRLTCNISNNVAGGKK